MPVPAELPRPPSGSVGTAWTRPYRDAASRPLSGTVTLTPARGTPVQITEDVVDGVVTFHVAPGSYRLNASLLTVDGARFYDFDTVEVG